MGASALVIVEDCGCVLIGEVHDQLNFENF
jgi:hypothetical protein